MLNFKKLNACVVSRDTLHYAFSDTQVKSYRYLGETVFLKGYLFNLKDGTTARLYIKRYGGILDERKE